MCPVRRSNFLLPAAFAAIVVLSGCDDLNPSQTSNKPPAKMVAAKKDERAPVHRFVLTRYDSDVAFDTQTGQICRTWDWSPIGKVPKPDPDSGSSPQRKFGEFTPTCASLYQQYPSATSPESESLPDQQPAN
jgi:hypothetical protein